MSLIPSAPLKLGRVPALTHVLPPTSTSRFCPSMSLAPPRLHSRRYPPRLCLDHSHCLVLAPAPLAALPSTRSIPTLATCSMSLIPSAPFKADLAPDDKRFIAHCK